MGADFKNDGNTGRGKVFDLDCPPQRNLSFDYSTQRERAYDDIPFMSTLGLFAEESFNLRFARRNLNIVAGVRYDKVFDFDGVVSPRINASLEIIPNKLFVRGGYGITAKTPTLAILYPQEAYFDLLNFNNAPSTSTPDAQKFQVITTRVFDTKNYDLEMATATKYEAGIDFKIGQVRGAFTVFKDRSDNGYTFSPTLDSYRSVDLVKYAVAELPEDGTTLPVLKEESTTPVLLSYAMPTNNAACETRGIEMSLDFGASTPSAPASSSTERGRAPRHGTTATLSAERRRATSTTTWESSPTACTTTARYCRPTSRPCTTSRASGS